MIQLQENLRTDGRTEGQTLLPTLHLWSNNTDHERRLAVLNAARAICWEYA